MPEWELPSISIVVPNFNGGATLGRTLASLLEQRYPRLEILVVDGGSTDASLEIIKQYEKHLAWWVSERDLGQSHALNKGFARATGEVVNWLCSDDWLEPGALEKVGRRFAQEPAVDVVVGRTRMVFEAQGTERVDQPTRQGLELLPINNAFSQQSCFWRRGLMQRPTMPDGALNESYHYAMDLELWAYFKSRGARWEILDQVLGVFRHGQANKTSVGGEKVIREFERIYRTYCPERISLTFWHRHLRHPLERFRNRHKGRLAYALVRPAQVALVLALGPFYGFSRVRAMNWSWWC